MGPKSPINLVVIWLKYSRLFCFFVASHDQHFPAGIFSLSRDSVLHIELNIKPDLLIPYMTCKNTSASENTRVLLTIYALMNLFSFS